MINEIIVKNMLSFNEQTQLNLRGTCKTMIVGPNGSGKSNVLHIMEYLHFLVLNLQIVYNIQGFNSYNSNAYSDDVFSEIQCSLNIDLIEYIVYFKFKLGESLQIVDEHIQKIENGKSVDIYQCVRSEELKITGDFSEMELERIQTYNLDETSLISIINDENIVLQNKQLVLDIFNVFNYFRDKIIFDDFMEFDTARFIFENPEAKTEIIDFLNECNINISDIHIYDYTDQHQQQLIEQYQKKLDNGIVSELEYKNITRKIRRQKRYRFDTVDKNDINLPYNTESKGTKNLIAVLATLLANEDAVIFFDELETSFHELLCIKLINMVNKRKSNQIIFTTHLIELMDYKLFSKNEVFTIYKDELDCSKIIQLSSYKDLRSDEKHSWKNWYRMKKISGYPNFKVG